MLSLEEATLKMLQEDLQEETDKEIIDKPQSIGATMKDMYNQLDQTEGITNVEGLVDDILVVTDPEVTSEEYDEVIEKAQEIVEDTPEGNVPFDEEYVGQYLLTCPICGTTFVSQQMLEPGATCPACMEVPESFVVKGKIDTDENVAIDNGLQVDEEQKEETEAVPDTTTIEDTEEPVEEEDIEKQTASKEIPEGNKLQESISNEDKTFSSYRFVSLYPDLKQFSSDANEYENLYNENSFKSKRSGGVYKDNETEQKLKELDKKLTKEIYDTLVDNNTYIVIFDDAKQQLIIGKTDEEVKSIIDNYRKSTSKDNLFDGYDVNSYELFKDWFDKMDYPRIGHNVNRIKVNIKTETKTIKTEDTYEEGIFYEIEAALMEAGLNPVRFSESGVMTNNLGWTVTGEDGTEQQLTCDGSYLTESQSTENKLQEAPQQVPGIAIKKVTEEEDSKEVSQDQLPTSGEDIEVLVTENSVGYLLRGLIIDHKNKQFQYVLGQSLPLGKYKRVSKNTIRNTINDLQNQEYTEYKGKDSIELEESVEYAKFAKFKKLV